MQKLNPLKVPWQVSPSTPFLRLFVSESSSDQPTQLIFVANFGLRSNSATMPKTGFSTARQMVNPHQLKDESARTSKTHSLVKIEFQDGLWTRFSPGYSDTEILNPREFHFTSIPFSGLSSDIVPWLRDFRQLWANTGYCPDPGAYTVEESEWINRLSVNGFEHFIVQGHDAYVEILARSWKWAEIEQLPEGW